MSDPSQGDGVLSNDDGNFTLHFFVFFYFFIVPFVLSENTMKSHFKSLNTSLCGGNRKKKSKRAQKKKVRGFSSPHF